MDWSAGDGPENLAVQPGIRQCWSSETVEHRTHRSMGARYRKVRPSDHDGGPFSSSSQLREGRLLS